MKPIFRLTPENLRVHFQSVTQPLNDQKQEAIIIDMQPKGCFIAS